MNSSEMTTSGSPYADEPGEVIPTLSCNSSRPRSVTRSLQGWEADGALTFFADRLADVLPIPEPVQEQTVVLAPGAAPDVKGQSAFRFASRDKTTIATIYPTRFALETSDYERYGKFRSLLTTLVETFYEYARPAGIERVGLRYIDEIKIPSITETDPAAWRPFIDSELLAPVDIADEALPDKKARIWHGLLQFDGSEQTTLVLRFGAFEGNAVDPNGPLTLSADSRPAPSFSSTSTAFGPQRR